VSSRARSHSGPRTELRAAALAGLVALTLAAAGCGSEDSQPASAAEPDGGKEVVDISGTEPVGEMLAGSVAPLVTCADWNDATEPEKLATIEDVRSQINLLDSGIDMPALTDDEAMEVFDGSCSPSWAYGYRLYKLYARAAGWVSLKREIDESAE
jgi:hypothetical protein